MGGNHFLFRGVLAAIAIWTIGRGVEGKRNGVGGNGGRCSWPSPSPTMPGENLLCDSDLWSVIKGEWIGDCSCSIENTDSRCGNVIWIGSDDGLTPDSDFDCDCFEMTVVLEIAAGGRDAGVMFRTAECAETNNAGPNYYVGLDPDADDVVFGSMDDGWTELHTASVDDLCFDKEYTLRIRGCGDTYSVFVDGEAVLEDVTATAFSSGSIGLRTYKAPSKYHHLSFSCDVSTTSSTTPAPVPTRVPTAKPTTVEPTAMPTVSPSAEPSHGPSSNPSAEPTASPSAEPSAKPTATPSAEPSSKPSLSPSAEPSAKPSAEPSSKPTASPSAEPSAKPSASPSAEPSAKVTPRPTDEPSPKPTSSPSAEPSHSPSSNPSAEPTASPSAEPSAKPSAKPSANPTAKPTATPTAEPSAKPTASPSAEPSSKPSLSPSAEPSAKLTPRPTADPSAKPSAEPSSKPTASPSAEPSPKPTVSPSAEPSPKPTSSPSAEPSDSPSSNPSAEPTASPSAEPSSKPTSSPSAEPSDSPSSNPSAEPTASPSAEPSPQPTGKPSTEPSHSPSADPSADPTASPTTAEPTREPTMFPTFPICDTDDALNIAFLMDESGSVDSDEWDVIVTFVDRIATYDVAGASYVSLFEYASLPAFTQFLEWTPLETGRDDITTALERNPYNTAGTTYTWDAVNRVLDEFWHYRKNCTDGCETRHDILFLLTDGAPTDTVCPDMVERANTTTVDIVIIGIGTYADSTTNWMSQIDCLDVANDGEDIYYVTEFEAGDFNAIEGVIRNYTCDGEHPATPGDRGGAPWVYDDGSTGLGPVPTTNGEGVAPEDVTPSPNAAAAMLAAEEAGGSFLSWLAERARFFALPNLVLVTLAFFVVVVLRRSSKHRRRQYKRVEFDDGTPSDSELSDLEAAKALNNNNDY